jgi:hypothetical protein
MASIIPQRELKVCWPPVNGASDKKVYREDAKKMNGKALRGANFRSIFRLPTKWSNNTFLALGGRLVAQPS